MNLPSNQWGRDSFGLVCSSLATIKPQQTVGSPKVNFADNRTKNYTCTHTNSEHRRSVIRADADLLDEASKSRSYGASLFSIYQLQDKSEVQIKLGMSPALKYRFSQFWLVFSIMVLFDIGTILSSYFISVSHKSLSHDWPSFVTRTLVSSHCSNLQVNHLA